MSDYLSGINLKIHLREAAIIIGAVLKANAELARRTGNPNEQFHEVREQIRENHPEPDFKKQFIKAYQDIKDALKELNPEKATAE